MSTNYDNSGTAFLIVASLACGGFFLIGLSVGLSWGERGIRSEAIEAGVAKWELESQENPQPVFKWLPPTRTPNQ